MIEVQGDRLSVRVPMTMERATALLNAGAAAFPASGDAVIDLAAVKELDSSALAVVFGWQRLARARGASVSISNAPESLLTLAQVYGVADLLPVA